VLVGAFGAEVDVQRLHDVMAWLDAGLPLTLVMDLLDEHGPNSTRILQAERPQAGELEWLSTVAH
jgi:hypothetical protein